MNIPEDLQGMYNHCLDRATKDVDTIPVSPEMILALIERIGDLETDSLNLESYVHYECHKKIRKEKQRSDDLTVDINRLKQQMVDLSMVGKNEN